MILILLGLVMLLGCAFWIYRVFEIPSNNERTTLPNKLQIVEKSVLVLFISTFFLSVGIWAISTTVANRLNTELLSLQANYSENIMYAPKQEQYVMWFPDFAEDDQFMTSTIKLLTEQINNYNKKVKAKQKEQNSWVYGNLIRLKNTNISIIEDPSKIKWIAD